MLELLTLGAFLAAMRVSRLSEELHGPSWNGTWAEDLDRAGGMSPEVPEYRMRVAEILGIAAERPAVLSGHVPAHGLASSSPHDPSPHHLRTARGRDRAARPLRRADRASAVVRQLSEGDPLQDPDRASKEGWIELPRFNGSGLIPFNDWGVREMVVWEGVSDPLA